MLDNRTGHPSLEGVGKSVSPPSRDVKRSQGLRLSLSLWNSLPWLWISQKFIPLQPHWRDSATPTNFSLGVRRKTKSPTLNHTSRYPLSYWAAFAASPRRASYVHPSPRPQAVSLRLLRTHEKNPDRHFVRAKPARLPAEIVITAENAKNTASNLFERLWCAWKNAVSGNSATPAQCRPIRTMSINFKFLFTRSVMLLFG